MKKEIYLGLGTGIVGLGLTAVGLIIRSKNKDNTVNEYSEILKEKSGEIIELKNTISKLDEDNDKLKNQINKLSDLCEMLFKERLDLKEKEEEKFNAIKGKLENYLDDSKINLYDMRCAAVFNDDEKVRDNNIVDFINKFIDISERIVKQVNDKDLACEYLNEFRESISGMTSIIDNIIKEDAKRNEKDVRLKNLICSIDTIFADLSELKEKMGTEKDYNKCVKTLKKMSAKVKYIRTEIVKYDEFKDNEVVLEAIRELDKEEEFIKKMMK